MGPPGQPRSRRSGRLGFWGIPPFLALFEAIALAVHFQNVDMVGQAIQQGSGQAFGTEDFRPFIERQIGGDNHRAAFVTLYPDPASDVLRWFPHGHVIDRPGASSIVPQARHSGHQNYQNEEWGQGNCAAHSRSALPPCLFHCPWRGGQTCPGTSNVTVAW